GDIKEFVFDTTIEEISKSENIFKPENIYQPMLIVLGKKWIPTGLERAIINANVNETIDVVIQPEDAYGPKDPAKIKLVARREFQKLNINPSVGDRITLGSQTGTILSVSAGRVRIDYNHILAGKEIHYSVKIYDIIKGDEQKISALIKRRIPGADLENMTIEIKEDKIIVNLPEQARFFEYIQFAKAEVAKDISEILTNYKYIEFSEIFPII
ncbi:MAG: FKBP-type peptidyl-prolyl cis-trans isomerase, partial [Candidatus Heimdallarchaeota archaeon]|nr:FKBP-type peptidyl-prolyl cis-trans isomerase [Candidatus Heimdallarchaeota archaeon]